jgi:protein-tyrosine phosphatase
MMASKNYSELIKDRIYFGGADDVKEMMEHEKADIIFDLRAESHENKSGFDRIHSPIVDEAEHQDESIKRSIENVVNAYNNGKKVYFHCGGGSTRAGTVAVGTLLYLDKAKTIEEAEKIATEARPKVNVKPQMKEALHRIFPDA